MSNCRFLFLVMVFFVSGTLWGAATEAQELLFERDNPYACSYTEGAPFLLFSPAFLTKVVVWYDTSRAGDNPSFTLRDAEGNVEYEGSLRKGNCDPYQTQWCQGIWEPGLLELKSGEHFFELSSEAICQNSYSEGKGFIKVYGYGRKALYQESNPYVCAYTSEAPFSLREKSLVEKISIWYDSGLAGDTVAYSLFNERGEQVYRGLFEKGDCDPYQTRWCRGNSELNFCLPAGNYYVEIDSDAICQNAVSDGKGFITVYGYEICPGELLVDVKINGSDGPLTLDSHDVLSVTVSLDTNGTNGTADYFLMAKIADDSCYCFSYYTNEWLPCLCYSPSSGYMGALLLFRDLEVYRISCGDLPRGEYTLYFGVDTEMNGSVDRSLVYDSVRFEIVDVLK